MNLEVEPGLGVFLEIMIILQGKYIYMVKLLVCGQVFAGCHQL